MRRGLAIEDESLNAAVLRRLSGSANRIAWTPAQIDRICEKFGVSSTGVPHVELRYRSVAARAHRAAPDPSPATGDRTYTFTISTNEVDRMGDTISISGWQLSAYRTNPVVLWAHDGTLIPIGRATKVWIDGNRLRATAEMAPEDANPEAEKVNKLLKGGFLSATSVGFAPTKFAFTDDPARRFGIDFLEQELLEFSVVPVPANSSALVDAAKHLQGDAARRLRDLDLIRMRSTP